MARRVRQTSVLKRFSRKLYCGLESGKRTPAVEQRGGGSATFMGRPVLRVVVAGVNSCISKVRLRGRMAVPGEVVLGRRFAAAGIAGQALRKGPNRDVTKLQRQGGTVLVCSGRCQYGRFRPSDRRAASQL